ncbi:hypothetical protein CDAR_118771 [Caerostris darwini]|uniref:Uncharacterized protein n=1 Tax=Caerostris darwini TaxID=1538125 RepID=A0AAV4TSP2_9ARAC|nr:hypothetical protein CDAR_118771 [Caerostris darwini]
MKPCLDWTPVGKFRGNVSNNAKRSQIGSWFLLYTSAATLLIPPLLWAILAKNLKLNPAAFVALDLLSDCAWTFWTPPLITCCGFSTTSPYYEGFWFEIQFHALWRSCLHVERFRNLDLISTKMIFVVQ